MAAAEVSLALRSAGSKTATFNVELCADHVECSAVALILAQHARKVSFLVLLCATLPGGFGLLLAPLGVPIFVPLFLILLGVVGAALAPRLFQRLLAPPVATQNQ
jgi:hypothetical protein